MFTRVEVQAMFVLVVWFSLNGFSFRQSWMAGFIPRSACVDL